jgi:phenylacetate-coenzyme A ligase PaaK-like adenylate-forming protein
MPEFEELRTTHTSQYEAALPGHVERIVWSQDRLRAERERGLRELIRVAKERSLWHRGRLAHIDSDHVTEADLLSISPMTKDDMMENFDQVVTDPRLSREIVELHLDALTTGAYLFDEYSVVASGGSSGRRGVFVYDWIGWLNYGLINRRYRARAFSRARISPNAIQVIVGGGKASHMTYSMGRAFPLGRSPEIVPATLPLPEIVKRINELHPESIFGYPSMVVALARESLAGRLRIAPRIIACGGEPLLSDMRTVIGEAWGVDIPLLNGYFTSEGASATACGESRGMHLNEDLCIFEPVDAEGRPVSSGQRSAKLLVTPLLNHAQPLIRYELTDEVTLLNEEAPCPCGSAMRRIDDIGGRSDDVFAYAGGVTVHPMTFRSPLGRERHIIEYQVRQTRDGADVTLRADGPVSIEALKAALEDGLSAAGVRGPRVNVEIIQGAFERQATGKVKRFFPLA